MAEIIQEEKGGKGKKKAKKHAPHIDMTPMVDLMCLLITFFMLTTAFSKSKVMEITLPDKPTGKEEPPKAQASRTVNIILGPDDKIYWYPGVVKPEDASKNIFPPLIMLDYSPTGIRQMLLDKNRFLARKIADFNNQVTTGKLVLTPDSVRSTISKIKSDDNTGPIVLIKAYKKATYGNFVDVLDEMNICGIGHYMFVDITWYEEKMIELAMAANPTSSTSSNK